VIGADAVVTSTAVQADNPEVIAARKRKIPVVPRAMMLAELMRLKQGIAIAGTHGKTTTTSLVASVLAEGGLDPTFVIGGKLNSAGANAKLGAGDYIVVEADESDASFLNLLPVMAVVTNIDADHMETYGHDFNNLKKAFLDFLHRMPFYGTAILRTDERSGALHHAGRAVPGHHLRRRRGRAGARGRRPRRRPADALHGAAPQRRHAARHAREAEPGVGMHNVLNALSAIAIAVELNIPDDAVLKALAEFRGVGRRFQGYGDVPCRPPTAAASSR
jgi:UDP-N-acetylmuramate--alanine ligase